MVRLEEAAEIEFRTLPDGVLTELVLGHLDSEASRTPPQLRATNRISAKRLKAYAGIEAVCGCLPFYGPGQPLHYAA